MTTVPGLTTRPITAADATDIAALMATIEGDHPTSFTLSADEVAEILRDYRGIVFEGGFDGDRPVAFTTVLPRSVNEDGQSFILFGDVHPSRVGEGIGTTMLARALAAARAVHAHDGPGTPARYAASALAGRADQAALLRDAGFSLHRHSFLMLTELAGACSEPGGPRLPDGLRLEAFDPADSEELRAAHNAAFRDYPGGTAFNEEHWRTFMIDASHARPGLSFVVRDSAADDAVAAYLFTHEYAVPPSGRTGVREAYVAFLGTAAAHRERGLAAALLAHTLQACRAQGFDTVSLDVDTENPTGALGIYERAGFSVLHRHDNYHLVE